MPRHGRSAKARVPLAAIHDLRQPGPVLGKSRDGEDQPGQPIPRSASVVRVHCLAGASLRGDQRVGERVNAGQFDR